MNTTSDPRHFFETNAELDQKARRAAKAGNTYGHPVVLKSKLLAAILSPLHPSHEILVAEAAGTVRTVHPDDPASVGAIAVYRGPAAPVACLAVGGPHNQQVFAGSWDKTIWSWDVATQLPGPRYLGHADFVKALVCTQIVGNHCLISGGADKKIIVWHIGSQARLHTLQDAVVNMLALQHLAIDPVDSSANECVLFSASSDPCIRRWKIRQDSSEQAAVEACPNAPGTGRKTICEHETTVYQLVFDQVGDDADLWSVSGDGTAKCLSRHQGFVTNHVYDHGHHVRAVALTSRWVVTAGRDENVKFWDPASGTLHCSLQGHFDEITALVVLGLGHKTERVCSVSIDGTVRTWPTDPARLDELVREQRSPATKVDEDNGQNGPTEMLTADEEAELAALMDPA